MEITAQVPGTSNSSELKQPPLFYRITALWALSEAFLGGVLHALHLPGTGLFVGAASVLCISLLANYCPNKSSILKATVLVILVKGILGPHTPPGAYLAVAIQGGLGYLLFSTRLHFKVNCLLLGVITQLQSALQRLVVMLVMFGADLYQVADGFVNYILKKAGFAEGDYVLYVVLVYIGAHALMGVIVGVVASRLPGILAKSTYSAKQLQLQPQTIAVKPKRKNSLKRMFPLVLSTVGILLIVCLYLKIIVYNTAYSILIRAIVITVIWVWVLTPLLKKYLYRWSQKKRSVLANELDHIFRLMPFVQQQVISTWQAMSVLPVYKRILLFPANVIAAILHI